MLWNGCFPIGPKTVRLPEVWSSNSSLWRLQRSGAGARREVGRDFVPSSLRVVQIPLGENYETLAGKRGNGRFVVVDVQRQSGPISRADQKRIRVVDIDFSGQQRFADLGQRLRPIGLLDDQEVALGGRELCLLQDLQASFRIAQHQADDRAVGKVVNSQRDDANIGGLKPPHDIEKRADAVLEKDIELADTRPIPAVSS